MLSKHRSTLLLLMMMMLNSILKNCLFFFCFGQYVYALMQNLLYLFFGPPKIAAIMCQLEAMSLSCMSLDVLCWP